MFSTYLAAGLCAVAIVALFSMALIRGADERRRTEI